MRYEMSLIILILIIFNLCPSQYQNKKQKTKNKKQKKQKQKKNKNKIVPQYSFFPSDSLIKKKKSTHSQIKYNNQNIHKNFKI